jgi:hypothetical protein
VKAQTIRLVEPFADTTGIAPIRTTISELQGPFRGDQL